MSDRRSLHVRRKVLFRKGLDPALRIFDYELQVPEGHEVRWLKETLCGLDLTCLEELYDDKGGVGYHPQHLLGAILYGLRHGVRDSRALEDACLYDNRYRVLTDGLAPSYKTFERALVRFQNVLVQIMGAIFDIAEAQKMVSGLEVAVDGAKVGGASSEWKCRAGAPSSDPDARKMNSHGRMCLGYNAQIAVDTQGPGHLIVAADVIQDQNDLHAMPAILEAMDTQFGELPVQVFADKGYESAETIVHLENLGIESYIAPAKDFYPSLAENAEGTLVCPSGKPLVCINQCVQHEREMDTYRPKGGCRRCPLTKTCPFYGKRLTVTHGIDPGARFRNRARVRSQAASGAMLRRRLAEQPFAALRRGTRFNRFLRRGLEKVRAEFLLWVISYNLFRIWSVQKA